MGIRIMKLGPLVMLAIAVVSTSSLAEPQIAIEPETTRVYVNNQFGVDVMVNSEFDSLMGYDVTLRFDSSRLEGMNATEGSLPLDSGYDTFFMCLTGDMPQDSIWVNGSILGNTVAGPGVLFRANFQAQGPGITSIEIARSDVRDGENRKLAHVTRHGVVLVFSCIGVEPVQGTWGRIKSLFR